MNFGQALEALKAGKKVSRGHWNGQGIWIYLVPGSKFVATRPPSLVLYADGAECEYQAHIDMKTAQGILVPWTCSQSDMLAEDWGIVD